LKTAGGKKRSRREAAGSAVNAASVSPAAKSQQGVEKVESQN
jgi:hypothetical protein